MVYSLELPSTFFSPILIADKFKDRVCFGLVKATPLASENQYVLNKVVQKQPKNVHDSLN